jgi:cell division protein FtsB
MSIDLEYAIKKDIRNNPVVREIDLEQKREFFRTIGLAALIVATLLFSAVPHFRMVTNAYQVEELRQLLAIEQARQRTLRLQLEMRLAPGVIEQRARQELGMVAPSPDEVVIIERMTGAVPSRTLVAEVRGGAVGR